MQQPGLGGGATNAGEPEVRFAGVIELQVHGRGVTGFLIEVGHLDREEGPSIFETKNGDHMMQWDAGMAFIGRVGVGGVKIRGRARRLHGRMTDTIAAAEQQGHARDRLTIIQEPLIYSSMTDVGNASAARDALLNRIR